MKFHSTHTLRVIYTNAAEKYVEIGTVIKKNRGEIRIETRGLTPFDIMTIISDNPISSGGKTFFFFFFFTTNAGSGCP